MIGQQQCNEYVAQRRGANAGLPLKKGYCCWAIYNSEWYRARINRDVDNTEFVYVQYIDYGNEEPIPKNMVGLYLFRFSYKINTVSLIPF